MRYGIARDFRFGVQRLAFDVGREHEVDEAFRPSRRLLLDAADARALGRNDRAALRRKVAANEAEERRLAGAVAPHEPDPRARGQRRVGAVDQETFAEPIGKAVDVEHGELLARRARAGKIERALRVRLTGPTARRPSGKSPNGARAAQRGDSEEPRGPTRFDHARDVAFARAPAI